MRCASSTGCLTGTCNTQVPISIRFVTAAMTLISTTGSSVARPLPNESVTHSPANPRDSTCRARSAMRSSVCPAIAGSGRVTLTTCTFIAGGPPVSVLVSILSGQKALGEASEEAGADRQRGVVEVVARVVQVAAALAGTVADPQHRARPFEQHVREILTAKRRRDVTVDAFLAA